VEEGTLEEDKEVWGEKSGTTGTRLRKPRLVCAASQKQVFRRHCQRGNSYVTEKAKNGPGEHDSKEGEF